MNILYATADLGGCRYYRCELPGLQMHERGHTVCVTGHVAVADSGEIYAANATEATTEIEFDVVVMQRWMSSETVSYIRNARACGQIVINDVDDSFWDLPPSHPAYRQTDPARNLDNNRTHYKRAIAVSDAITVSTTYLAELLDGLGPPVHLLPNAIDPSRYDPQPVRDTTSPTFGWVGALNYRSPGDVRLLSEVVGPFLRAHPEVRFVHVGTRTDDPMPIASVLGVDPTRIGSRPFCQVSDLPRAMRGIEVALAPLEDTPFNRAKSWIKALESAAAGIPVIASDMPEYARLGVGVLCGSDTQWMSALERSLDPDERAASVQEGNAVVEQHDIRTRWTEWFDLYASLVPSHAGNPEPYAEATSNAVS